MANIKFTEFPSATVVGSMDIIPIVQDGANKKTTASVFQTYIGTLFVNLSGTQTITGSKTFSSPLISNVATGTAPFSVASTTKVTNLNADLLDGLSSAAFQSAITLTTTGTSGAATLVGSTLNIPNYADTDTGITSLNGLTALTQTFAVGTSGTDFAISSATSTHTFNLPTASAANRGALSSADWTTFNNKQNALTNPITGTGTTNYLPKFTGASALGDSSLVSDANGQLGLGVTPSAWNVSVFRAIQIGTGKPAFIAGRTDNSSNVQLGVNGFYDGSWKYVGSDYASRYFQFDGSHNWDTAPSGTAGNAITFTTAMKLDASGNLGIGTTSPLNKLDIAGNLSLSNAGANVFRILQDLGAAGYTGPGFYSQTSLGYGVANGGTHRFIGIDGNIEIMRLSAAGNLLLNTTTDAGYKLDVNGTARVSGRLTMSTGGYILTGNDMVWGDIAGDYIGQYYSGTSLIFYNGTGGASLFSIARSTGAATFSSSVTIGNFTTTQINALTPATGMVVFNTTLATLCFYDGSGWRKVSHSSM